MNKDVLGVIGALLLLAVSLFAFQGEILKVLLENRTGEMFVAADRDSFDPGPAVGQKLPTIRATYQGRVVTDLAGFSGERGLVFIANRSVDWCPYCMRQLVELQEELEGFRQAGLSVVAMTYDSPDQQEVFVKRYDIEFPMLSDIDAASMIALDILNTEYPPGDDSYGIPYPGIFLLDQEMRILGKLFLEDYSQRMEATEVLALARARLDEQ